MPAITQAFVLGAGLGTRLRPLTEDLPKPLIPIFQKPLITFALDHLVDAGIESFIINTHKLPETFKDVFPANKYLDHSVKLAHEPVLLETGGGIKNVEADLGKEPFITYSGDILTDVDAKRVWPRPLLFATGESSILLGDMACSAITTSPISPFGVRTFFSGSPPTRRYPSFQF